MYFFVLIPRLFLEPWAKLLIISLMIDSVQRVACKSAFFGGRAVHTCDCSHEGISTPGLSATQAIQGLFRGLLSVECTKYNFLATISFMCETVRICTFVAGVHCQTVWLHAGTDRL